MFTSEGAAERAMHRDGGSADLLVSDLRAAPLAPQQQELGERH